MNTLKKSLKLKVSHQLISNAYTLLLCSFLWISCSEKDQALKDDLPTILSISSPTGIQLFDHGNNGSSKDVYIDFTKSIDEVDVIEYRLIFSPTSNAKPSNDDLLNTESPNYYALAKTGSNISFLVNEVFLDINGDAVTEAEPYDAFLLSISGTEEKSSAVSSPIAITLNDIPYYEVSTLGQHPTNIEQLSINFKTNTIYSPFFQDKVYKMDIATGTSQLVESTPANSGPAGGNFDKSSDYYYSSFWYHNAVYRYDEFDNRTLVVSGIPTPTGIEFDTQGNMYVSSYESKKIYKVDPNGNKKIFAASSLFSSLDGLVFVGSDLYVANFIDHNISKVSANGSVELFASIENPTGEGNYTGYITYTNDLLYVPSVNKIYTLDLNGNINKIAGGESGYKDGPAPLARFLGTNGIKASITGDTVFIGDRSRIRMLIRKD